MGLKVSHGCFEGCYSTFKKFRYDLASQIGINLNDYKGYSETGKDLNTIGHPLMSLFNHSDSDGHLSPSECLMISQGLELILKKVDHTKNIDNDFVDMIKSFLEGLTLALSKGEIVTFG